MYAVIETCGKQYKVKEGDTVFFEKLEGEESKKINFDKVLLISDEKEIQIGNPYVEGYKVEGKIISHGKAKKIIVFKMKAKKNYRKKQGHRQPYTKVEIISIKNENKKEEKIVTKTENTEKKVTKSPQTKKNLENKQTVTKKPAEKMTTKKS